MPAVDEITVAVKCQRAADFAPRRLPLRITTERANNVITGRISGFATFSLVKLPPGDKLAVCFRNFEARGSRVAMNVPVMFISSRRES